MVATGGIDIGSAADWLAAVGGIVTAGVALYLLWQGQKDRRRLEAAKVSAQARRIRVSYPGVTSVIVNVSEQLEGAPPPEEPVTETSEIRNASSDVITDVVVTVHDLDGNGRPQPSSDTRFAARLLPSAVLSISREVMRARPAGGSHYDVLVQWVPLVGFTDANGLRWNINARHELSEGDPVLPTGADDDPVVRPFAR